MSVGGREGEWNEGGRDQRNIGRKERKGKERNERNGMEGRIGRNGRNGRSEGS